MSFKVLHIIDCFLPETMNWLERLLEESSDACEHHIYADFYTCKLNPLFQYAGGSIQSAYPIPLKNKIRILLQRNQNENQLLKYIKTHNIQLIHFHFGHVAIHYRDWIQKAGLPFCISLYGFDYEYLVHKKPGTKTAYVQLAKLGGRFIAEGNYSKNLLVEYKIPKNQLLIVHMLYARNKIESNKQFSHPIKLLQTASYTPKKNQRGLVEALQDRHAGKFIIEFYGEIVDRKYYNELFKLVQSRRNHCIKLNSKLSLDQYIGILNDTHFIVNLSKRTDQNDTEGGCPVFLKDGLSIGKPVISTRHCDIPELICNDYNGFLLPEDEISAVSDLLDRLIAMPQYDFIKLCRNAEESVSCNIQQKLTRKELLNVYQQMI